MKRRPINIEVSIEETGGDVAKLIKKFVKKVKKSNLMEELRERRFFVKPSKKRRMARLSKKRNAAKAEGKRQVSYDKKYNNNRSRR